MAKDKKPAINYTSRDYESIRSDLLGYVKRYYSDIYKDFNDASFGSLMVDTVAYVGDILSFYLDYQANESFMDSAIEYDNVIRHARSLGYKHYKSPVSVGMCSFYVLVPADLNANIPDYTYLPILKKGSILSTEAGITYTLAQDVDFSDPNNEVVVASIDENSESQAPNFFAVLSKGYVISGELAEFIQEVESFQRFYSVEIPGDNISEIVSVVDSDGNSYHEVDYLSQNTIFKQVPNRGANSDSAPSILKPVSVPRRFVVENRENSCIVQFGYGSESQLVSDKIIDPSEVSMKIHGRDYVTTPTFDPKSLTSTDKFGVAPENTTLRIVYRVNSAENMNAATRTINNVVESKLFFKNRSSLRDDMVQIVSNSLQVENDQPIIGDITLPKSDEIRRRALDSFATQSRAVTLQDYKSSVYLMPSSFGSIKRCFVERDTNDLKRNLNIHVISEDSLGNLTKTNNVIKQNLKMWLNSVRMISDTIDIKDVNVVNVGIKFRAITDTFSDKQSILVAAVNAIKKKFCTVHPEVGESILITDVFKVLKDVEGIIDVTHVNIKLKNGTDYADTPLRESNRISRNGRVFSVPKDYIWEIKHPDKDIEGTLI